MRSSSLGQISMCEQKYYLSYVLGWPDKQNAKAILGSVVHRCLESLANVKLAKEKGKRKVKDELYDNKLSDFEDLEFICRTCFDYYTTNCESLEFDESQYRTCLRWFKKALEYDNGSMNPLNQNIYSAEEFFSITIPHEWAAYEYKVGDEVIKGQLEIKGTVDVIISEGGNKYRVLDFKTGKRLNWATGKPKDAHYFQNEDVQLLLYYYALKTKYPDKEFYVSIYYINPFTQDGVKYDEGVFDVVFDEDDYIRAEGILREKFEYIRDNQHPKQLYSDSERAKAPKWGSDVFKCTYLCNFVKEWENSGKSICQHVHDKIESEGIDAVTAEYADLAKVRRYGSGGGLLAEEDKITIKKN